MNRDTLGSIVERVCREVRSDSAEVKSLIIDCVNDKYAALARARPWEGYLHSQISDSLATVSGQVYLAFPEDCAIPLKLIDLSQDYSLVPRDNEQLHEDFVDRIDGSGGPVIYYAPLGLQATKKPFSAADEISIIAASANDKSVDVVITGRRNSPRMSEREILTTNASTPQSTTVNGTITWDVGWSISSISTEADLSDYITVHERDDATKVLAELSRHTPQSQYFVIQLETDPGAANTLNLVYKRKVMRLVDDADVLMIPVASALVQYAIGTVLRFRGQYEQAAVHDGQADGYVGSVVAEQEQHRAHHRVRPAAARFRYKLRR